MANDEAQDAAVWNDVQSGLHDTAWIDVQKNTFTNWCNDRLKDTGLTVDDLEVDLRNGLTLIRLLEVLANTHLRYTQCKVTGANTVTPMHITVTYCPVAFKIAEPTSPFL